MRFLRVDRLFAVVKLRVPANRVLCDIPYPFWWKTSSACSPAWPGLFSGRGYNIDSLNVAPRTTRTASRMTIVTHGDEATVEQIVKQLNKLPDVLKVQDFGEGEYVDRELVLVKVAVDAKSRAEVMQITDIFRAKIVDVQPKSLTIEITGNESKVEKFIELMKPFGLLDLTRTGKAAMPRK